MKKIFFSEFHLQLERAWDYHQSFLLEQNFALAPLKSLYFGGGTPSLWGQRGARFFSHLLQRHALRLDPNCEWTMELNPGSWRREDIEEWMGLGVNRFSVGVQSSEDRYLQVLDRVHRRQEVFSTLKFLQEKAVNYSVDLMIGLPFSEKWRREVKSELKNILDYGPSHISLYILTVPKHYVHFASLPSEEWVEKEYLEVSDYLQERGMNHYEVSNYALPGRESLHNLQYWKMRSVAAIGPSATGFLVDKPDNALRYKWGANWDKKKPSVMTETLSESQVKLERLYLAMRTNEPIDAQSFFQGPDLDSWNRLLKRWEEHKYLLSLNPLRISPKGYLMQDTLMNDIFSAISNF